MVDTIVSSRLAGALALLALSSSCSSTFDARPCATDDDCGGRVCELEGGRPVCVAPGSAPVRIGMSGPVSGPSQALGTEMRLGVRLALDAQNAAGGVRGRSLTLEFRDDEYQPALAESAARALVDARVSEDPPRCPTTSVPVVAGQQPVSTTALWRGNDAVLAFLGNVGTPTMVRAAPVSLETGTLFFGAFTGAKAILRDGSAGACSRYVFNVRASYANEARATLEYFTRTGVVDARHLVSFDQNDSFGQAGYDGLVAAYADLVGFDQASDPTTPIARFRYTRDDTSSVPAQASAAEAYLSTLLASDDRPHVVGILMTDTYGAATEFIEHVRNWQFADDADQATSHRATRLSLRLSNVSFVGPNALADRLKAAGTVATPSGALPYTQDVVVSQVVPNYQDDQSDVVQDYRRLVAAADVSPTFTSLEGYLAARVFVAGLLAHRGPFTPDSLVATLEHLPDLGLGVGASSGFGPGAHDYSKSVWGTAIGADGTFRNVYFWSDGAPIQFFE